MPGPEEAGKTKERQAALDSSGHKQTSSEGVKKVADAVANGTQEAELNDDDLLTIHEVAEMLKLAVGTVYHLVSQQRIPHLHLSKRCLRFRRGSIRAWIASLGETPATNK